MSETNNLFKEELKVLAALVEKHQFMKRNYELIKTLVPNKKIDEATKILDNILDYNATQTIINTENAFLVSESSAVSKKLDEISDLASRAMNIKTYLKSIRSKQIEAETRIKSEAPVAQTAPITPAAPAAPAVAQTAPTAPVTSAAQTAPTAPVTSSIPAAPAVDPTAEVAPAQPAPQKANMADELHLINQLNEVNENQKRALEQAKLIKNAYCWDQGKGNQYGIKTVTAIRELDTAFNASLEFAKNSSVYANNKFMQNQVEKIEEFRAASAKEKEALKDELFHSVMQLIKLHPVMSSKDPKVQPLQQLVKEFVTNVQNVDLKKKPQLKTELFNSALNTLDLLSQRTSPAEYQKFADKLSGGPSKTLKVIGGIMLAIAAAALILAGIVFFAPVTIPAAVGFAALGTGVVSLAGGLTATLFGKKESAHYRNTHNIASAAEKAGFSPVSEAEELNEMPNVEEGERVRNSCN